MLLQLCRIAAHMEVSLRKHRLYNVLIGDRAFYKRVLHILVPGVIHMSVANFVNLLDNIMVGSLGTAQVSGVAITNQLMFVFNMIIFGVLGAAGIFSAQYFGAKDTKGVRNVFRAKLWMSLITLLIAFFLLITYENGLISLYLKGDGDPVLAGQIMQGAKNYLHIMLWGLVPFALSQCYATTMREAGELHVSMRAGVVALVVNLTGNWLLIFGNLGFPALGVQGAAIATVLSRYVELAIIVYAGHKFEMFHFFKGVYRSIKVPGHLIQDILKKGSPLIVNEIFWSVGMATLMQTYTLRGLPVLAATNISSTISNLFNAVLISTGSTVAVIIGQQLGAGKVQEARRDIWKLIFFGFAGTALVALVMGLLAPLFPRLYNTEDNVRHLATSFIISSAMLMPFHSISNCSYFALRSGGSTFITFLFDAAFNWVIVIPLTLFLVHGTSLHITTLYFLSQAINLLKSVLGVLLIRHGVWAKNLVSQPAA